MTSDVQTAVTTHRWWVLAVACIATFRGVLDSTNVYAALPVIALDLGFARQKSSGCPPPTRSLKGDNEALVISLQLEN